jgi:predicted phage tail protein
VITPLDSVPAQALMPGDIIHIEPHMVQGRTVGRRTVDVEVDGIHYADPADSEVVVDWRETARLTGGDPRVTGATVYGQLQRVLLLSRLGRIH